MNIFRHILYTLPIPKNTIMSDAEDSDSEYNSVDEEFDDQPKIDVGVPRSNVPASGVRAENELEIDDDDDEDNSIINTDDDEIDDDDDDEDDDLFKEFNPDAQPDNKKKSSSRRKADFATTEPELDADNDGYNSVGGADDDSEYDEDDDDIQSGEKYLQKFNDAIRKNVVVNHHPELAQHNYEEIDALTTIVRDQNGIIVDPLHRTLPFLTKYERARVLGERAKQINSGATPFVKVDESVIDGYLIACKELEERKLPFIIKRPMTNGGSEYWKLKDLEMI